MARYEVEAVLARAMNVAAEVETAAKAEQEVGKKANEPWWKKKAREKREMAVTARPSS
jgi:hypothetical protein